MAKNVTGELLSQNYELQLKFNELFRQINQDNGYPFNFENLMIHLQNGTEGRFDGNPILQLLSKGESIIIDACDGTETLANAKNVFKSGIDSDFKNWKLDNAGKITAETAMAVHKIVKDATFAQMFGSFGTDLEKLCLTQHQIKVFCKKHPNWLRTEGYATFFLFKKDDNKPATLDNLFVAYVDVTSDGLCVDVYEFSYGNVWHAKFAHRVVVPQLAI